MRQHNIYLFFCLKTEMNHFWSATVWNRISPPGMNKIFNLISHRHIFFVGSVPPKTCSIVHTTQLNFPHIMMIIEQTRAYTRVVHVANIRITCFQHTFVPETEEFCIQHHYCLFCLYKYSLFPTTRNMFFLYTFVAIEIG